MEGDETCVKGLMEGAWGGTEENPLIASVLVDVKTVGTITQLFYGSRRAASDGTLA